MAPSARTSTFGDSTSRERGQASHEEDASWEVILHPGHLYHGTNISYIFLYVPGVGNIPFSDYGSIAMDNLLIL